MKTTESGYMLTIEVWLPANPAVPGEMAFAAEVLGNASRAEFRAGDIWLGMTEPPRWRWIARRKVPAPTIPAQEGTGSVGGSPEPTPLPAADPLEIPPNLRRVPR